MTREHLDNCVTLILNTRELCGDERRAVREYAIENGFGTNWKRLYGAANFEANRIWNEWQKAAGVPAKYTF